MQFKTALLLVLVSGVQLIEGQMCQDKTELEDL